MKIIFLIAAICTTVAGAPQNVPEDEQTASHPLSAVITPAPTFHGLRKRDFTLPTLAFTENEIAKGVGTNDGFFNLQVQLESLFGESVTDLQSATVSYVLVDSSGPYTLTEPFDV
jgi:hypothetical protein